MHPRTLRAASGIVVAAVAATVASPAHAELLYEFTFNATVTQKWGENPDHPWGGVELGDPAHFKYVIDVEQEDQVPSPVFGRYTVTSAEVSYGGIAVEPDFIGLFEVRTATVWNDHQVKLAVRQLWSDDFNEGALFELRGFNVLPDDSIPIDFDVLDFTTARSIGYGDGVSLGLSAQIDSYSYQIVPAPGAALGVLLGACFRTGRRRRP